MHKLTLVLAMLTGLAATSTAYAGWGDFEAAFPTLPCQDGWASCIQGGQVVSPELGRDRQGNPTPGDMRVAWFDLQATAAFSPFVDLSPYTGEARVAKAEPVPVAAPAAQPSRPAATSRPAADVTPPSRGTQLARAEEPVPNRGNSMVRPGSGTAEPVAAPHEGGMTRPGSSVRPSGAEAGTAEPAGVAAPPPVESTARTEAPVEAPAATGGMTRPGALTRPVAAEGTDAVAAVEAPAATPEPPAALISAVTPAAPVVVDDSCDNIVKLEPSAMMGKLSDGQTACLEASFAAAGKQTDKDRISRVLMTNAYSKGDQQEWAKLMKRHLEDVDQSDPDLCYKYALYLNKRGASRAYGVIKWSNVALENRTVWTGDTYTTRVYSLYKLRAAASQTLWQAAEEKNAVNPTDETKGQVSEARNQTKVYAREWYEYAKAAGKDTTKALQLCVSAAGTAEYCEGQ
ncbi:MAG: hypothetical protein JXX28_10650 [Deltaproteobacteria bacterium]|nr:hypothetical protein [Deltaproteobacteria bacterium]